MAQRNAVKKPEKSIIIKSLDIRPVNRSNVDIQNWRNALRAAEGDNENRKQLYDLYADMVLDGHLKSLVDKRIMAITNTDIMIVKDGKPLIDLWPVILSKQFANTLKYIIEAKLYGHSLIEFTPTPTLFTAELIDRRHIKPKAGMVTKYAIGGETGITYREKPYSNWVVEVGEKNDFGLLLQASQYVIYKRGGFGDWADFCQLFGIPFRHGKYKNPETRKTLDEALKNMGSAGYAVTPDDAEIAIIKSDSASGSSTVFKEFKDACNAEMSITILGQTMTTSDTANSGYAQGKVHQDVEEETHKDDMKYVLTYLNNDFMQILANMGYPVEGAEFAWVETDNMNLKDRIAIDKEVIALTPVDRTYLYEKYGIPVPATEDTVGGASTPLSPQEPTNKNGKKLNDTPHEALSPFGGGVRRTGEDSEQAWFEKLFNFFVQASGR